MARKEIGGVMDDNNLNKVNHNFKELYDEFGNVVRKVSDEAFEKVVDSAKLDWSKMVDTFDDLPTDAKVGDTRGVKSDSKVYRYDGNNWVEIYEINLNPISEVDDRLSSQLADNVNYTNLAMSTLVTGKKRKMPIVSIVSDDGGKSDLSKLHPLLDSKGVRAGLGIITSRVGTSGYMTWEEIKLMESYGYEIMSHSDTHRNLRDLTEAEIDEEVYNGYKKLIEKGFRPKGFVYPFNADNETTRSVVGRYFSSAYTKTELRTQGRNYIDMNNQAIRRVAIGSYFDQSNEWDGNPDTSSIEYYKWRVDEAIENKNWLVFVIHPGPTPTEQWEIINELLDYIIAKNVPILKPSDAFSIYSNLIDVRSDKGELIVDNQGVPVSGFSEVIIEKEVNKYTAINKISDFPNNKVVVSYVTSNKGEGFPGSRPGTLITINVGERGFEKQFYLWHDSSIFHIRRVNAYGDSVGDFGEWFEVGRTFERVLGRYTAETLPSEFPTYDSFGFYVNSLIAEGTPKNEPGIINVYKATSETGYVSQDFRPYNKNELWIRSGNTNDEWTDWKQLI